MDTIEKCPLLDRLIPNGKTVVSRIPENLDQDYVKIMGIRSREEHSQGVEIINAATKTHELLNRAFYPLVFDLNREVENLSEYELHHLAQNAKDAYVGHVGKYGQLNHRSFGDTPFPDIDAALAGFPTKQEIVSPQNGSGPRYYNLQKNPQYFKKFAYVPTDTSTMGKKLGSTYRNIFSLNITPVGEYGERLGREMSMTSRILSDLMTQLDHEYSLKMLHTNSRLLKETQR